MTRVRKTRIAPTPSGYLHQGNAVSFVITAAITQLLDARLFLRFDDLDQQRVKPVFFEDTFEQLAWLGIEPDEGPSSVENAMKTSQHSRRERYQGVLNDLVTKGQVYSCQCSRKEIQQATGGSLAYPGTCFSKKLPFDFSHSWRFRLKNSIEEFNDVARQRVKIDLETTMGDFIIRRKQGLPGYHLASVIDDLDYGITFIVRGEDLIASTAAQRQLSRHIKYSFHESGYFHHGLLNGSDGLKLSKSRNSSSLVTLREGGLKAGDLYRAASQLLGLQVTGNLNELASAIGKKFNFEN